MLLINLWKTKAKTSKNSLKQYATTLSILMRTQYILGHLSQWQWFFLQHLNSGIRYHLTNFSPKNSLNKLYNMRQLMFKQGPRLIPPHRYQTEAALGPQPAVRQSHMRLPYNKTNLNLLNPSILSSSSPTFTCHANRKKIRS